MELDADSILRAAIEVADQIEPGTQIYPQPVPTSVKIERDGEFVVITLTTPIGQNTYFLEPESADKIADGLKETAARLLN